MNTGMSRPRRPAIVLVAAHQGEQIMVTNRPSNDELGNWELTGDYRIPMAGEHYWYWYNTQFPKGRRKGCVRQCQGQAYGRFHIVVPLVAAAPVARSVELDLMAHLEAMHKRLHETDPAQGQLQLKWQGVASRSDVMPAEIPRDPISVSGWTYEAAEA